MALDAETGSLDNDQVNGSVISPFVRTITFNGDAAYATGGSANFTAFVREVLGGSQAYEVVGLQQLSKSGDNELLYDKNADKLMVLLRSTGAEVANAFDLSAVSFTVALTLV